MPLGLLGVALFSLTAPATRCAALAFGGIAAGWLRIAAGGIAAIALLALTRAPPPPRRLWVPLIAIGACVTLGFPVLLSLALASVPASHAAVVLAALPLLTAIGAALRGGERPPAAFWAWSAAGAMVVVLFMARSRGVAGPSDALLLFAVLAGAVGYIEGARLTPLLGWRTIAWAVAAMTPLTVTVAICVVVLHPPPAVPAALAWLALAYVAIVSQLLGFVPWYRALALGGIARIGQLQLAMPFLSLAAAALWLGEPLLPSQLLAAALVCACIAGCQLTRAARPPRAATTAMVTERGASGAVSAPERARPSPSPGLRRR